ncbi:hypothetical protein BKM88_04395 [Anaplasma marginale]|nr:hypothetical protein CQZ76_04395 [Anaplasma marginale]AXW85302.1 hypothetical protein BKM88_04395 [Anaplasma marginale]KAA8472572.1 DUF1455 domain-containing protein [Anaplasma marginale]KAB0450993.1 DUF1455 domain-containing protein [Anaplasma marginale]TZF78403.1 DUF1455 domain-containing protein [Anaplasma marginale]
MGSGMSCRAFSLKGLLAFTLLPGSLATASRPSLLRVGGEASGQQTSGGGFHAAGGASATRGRLTSASAVSAPQSFGVLGSTVWEDGFLPSVFSPAQELLSAALQPSPTPSSWVFGRTAISGVRGFLERTVFLVF